MPIVLAPLGLVIIGFMALLLLLAGSLFASMLSNAIPRLSLLGLLLDGLRAIGGAIMGALNAMFPMLIAIARSVVSFFTAPAHSVEVLANAVDAALWAHTAALRNILFTRLPALQGNLGKILAAAIASADAYSNGLFSNAAHLISNLANYTNGAINALSGDIGRRLDVIRAQFMTVMAAQAVTLQKYTNAVVANAEARMNATNAATVALLGSTVNNAVAYAQRLAEWAQATAYGAATEWAAKNTDARIASTAGAVAGDTAIALSPAWPTAIDGVGEIADALPGSIADVLARAGAIPQTIPLSLPLSIGAIAGISTIALDWVKNCGLSLCKNTHRFGEELSSLGDAAMLTVLLGLVSGAILDPEGAAREVHNVITGPLEELVHESLAMINEAA